MSEHLLLTSFAVPRLVKRVLSKLRLYAPTDGDERDISTLEPLLNLPNVFAEFDSDDENDFAAEDFAWRHVLQQEDDRQLHQYIEKKAEELFPQQEGHEGHS